jgi:hypothetical protein
MAQVALPALSAVFEVLQAVAPPDPLTSQVILPVGVFEPEGPATLAVKVTEVPGSGDPVVAELVTTSVGVVNLVAAEAGNDPSPTIAAATDVKRIANARNPANRKMRITFLFLIFGNLIFGNLH